MGKRIQFHKLTEYVYTIEEETHGSIGDLFYNKDLSLWLFFPKNNFFYKPVYLAIILTTLNKLNGYKRRKD